MVFSVFKLLIFPLDDFLTERNFSIILIDLFNWIPFFWCFWALKKYLINQKLRNLCAEYFALGCIPLIISCISQYWFKWYGPFEFLNGLVTWFQRPICSGEIYEKCVTGVTGFFNNPNVTGSYLTLIFPFVISLLINKFKTGSSSKYFYSILLILFITFILLTSSRNAFLGMLISFILLLNNFWLSFTFIFLVFTFLPIVINYFDLISNSFLENINNLIPYNIRAKIDNIGVQSIENLPRYLIYKTSLEMILSKPLFGWGASIYPIIYLSKNGLYSGHSHNLFLELAINYGIFVSTIFLFYSIWLFFKSFKVVNAKENYQNNFIEKAWYTSAIIFISTHLFDILYFDIRISMTFWIILSGLNSMISEKRFKEEKKLLI